MLFHLEESECNGLPTTTPRIHAGACYTLFLNGSSLCHMHLLTRLLLLYYIRLHFSSRHLDPPRPKPHPTPPHSTLLRPHLTPPHPIPFHSTSLQPTPTHSTPLHFTPFHSNSLHFICRVSGDARVLEYATAALRNLALGEACRGEIVLQVRLLGGLVGGRVGGLM